MRSPNKVGHKWFGKVPVEVAGREAWDKQDASQSWTDGGAVKKILASIEPLLERLVASEAIGAVADFASTGEAAVRAGQGGEVVIGLRITSEQSSMIVSVPLRKLLVAALTEVRNGIALDPQAQALLADLVSLGRQLSRLGQPPPQVSKPIAATVNGAHQ